MDQSNTTCPLCEDDKDQYIESRYVYGGTENQDYIFCQACDFYYITPKPSEKDLEEFYINNFEDFMDKRSGDDSNWKEESVHAQIQQRETKRRIPFLQNFLKEDISILEVGASTGFMLSAIKDIEPSSVLSALEPSKQFSTYLEKSGFECYRNFSEISKNKRFDLIIHFFVIAHVYDFEVFLLDYMSKLNDGGQMIFETPSATDPLYRLYDIPEFKSFYWQVAHIVSFTNKSMKYFLDKHSFKYEIIPHQRYDLSNHMVWMQEGKPGGRDRYSDIFSVELEDDYKVSLENKWLCDSMIVKVYK